MAIGFKVSRDFVATSTLRLTCKVKFDDDSTSYWSGAKKSRARLFTIFLTSSLTDPTHMVGYMAIRII